MDNRFLTQLRDEGQALLEEARALVARRREGPPPTGLARLTGSGEETRLVALMTDSVAWLMAIGAGDAEVRATVRLRRDPGLFTPLAQPGEDGDLAELAEMLARAEAFHARLRRLEDRLTAAEDGVSEPA